MHYKFSVVALIIVSLALFAGAAGYSTFTKRQAPSAESQQFLTAYQDGTDQIPSSNNTVSKKSIIKIPFIDIGGALGLDDKNLVGCGDTILYVSREIEPVMQPLHAVYKELFATGATIRFQGKELANPIADQAKERTITYENRPTDVFKPLRFVKVEIQGTVAKVYLEGDLVSNECNDPRVEAQILFAARQFPNISEVKTYLNGKEFHWRAWMNQGG